MITQKQYIENECSRYAAEFRRSDNAPQKDRDDNYRDLRDWLSKLDTEDLEYEFSQLLNGAYGFYPCYLLWTYKTQNPRMNHNASTFYHFAICNRTGNYYARKLWNHLDKATQERVSTALDNIWATMECPCLSSIEGAA